MYSNKLVCSVKANGKFLREEHRGNESTVYLPFKTEYALFLKNLSERRALAHVDIDGKNMTEGGLIVAPGSAVDLERPANLSSGRKFKFIEKTAEISNFRGDNPEDGLIVVKWQFEKPYPTIIINPWPATRWIGGTADWIYYNQTDTNSSAPRDVTYTACNSVNPQVLRCAAPHQPQGITVEGSRSHQVFTQGSIGDLEATLYSMVIKLYGGQRPIYVSEKIQCPTCGRKWKMSFEFCGNCGTALK